MKRKHTIMLTAIAGLTVALAPLARAATFTWVDRTTAGEWTDQTRWDIGDGSPGDDGYPNTAGDTARIIPYGPMTPQLTVNVSDPVTVGILNAVDNGATDSKNYAIDVTVSDDGQITFDNNGSGAQLLTGRYFGSYTFSVYMVLADDLLIRYGYHDNITMTGTISEGGGSFGLTLRQYDKMRNGTWTIGGYAPNTYSGGTYIEIVGQVRSDNPKVKLDKDGAMGTGDVTIGPLMDGYLWITSDSVDGIEDRIADSASLYLINADLDATTYTLRLDANVNETVAKLYFDGVQQVAGTWSATAGAGVDHVDTVYLNGAGILTVLAGPFTMGAASAENISTDEAELGGEVLSGNNMTSWGTVWDTVTPPVANFVAITEGAPKNAPFSFSHVRTGMSAGEYIYYYAWASNAVDGVKSTATEEFYTEPGAAADVVITDIHDNDMTISWTPGAGSAGSLVVMRAIDPVGTDPADGSAYIANAAFGTPGTELGAGYVVYAGSGSSVTVNSLLSSTTYHVAVYPYVGPGALINYQQDAPAANSEKTTGSIQIGLGDLTVTAIGTNGATLGATILSGENITSWGTVWDTSSPPRANVEAETGTPTLPEVFTQVRTGMTPGSHVYFQGWASNAVEGTVHSTAIGQFDVEPLQASDVSFSAIGSTNMTVGWTPGAGSAGSLVVMRSIDPVQTAPADGSTYTANNAFGTPGTELGSGYVVYAGSGSSVTVNNLVRYTTYHVAVYAYSGSGSLNYQPDSPARGNQQTLWTPMTFTWADGTRGGEWTDPDKWTGGDGGYPRAPGDIANITTTWAIDINVSSPVRVGKINGNFGATFGFTGSDTGKITFDNNDSRAEFITINAGWNSSAPMELAEDLLIKYGYHGSVNMTGVITDDGTPRQLRIEDNTKMRNGTWTIGGAEPNTYSGGTFVELEGQVGNDDNPKLKLDKDGALGTGDVEIGANMWGYLWITSSGGDEDRIADSAALYLVQDTHTPSATPYTLVLDANVNETVGALFFDGIKQPEGTYSAVAGDGVNYVNTVYLSGSGVLTVGRAMPGMLLIVR